jgi:hypothetical protein
MGQVAHRNIPYGPPYSRHGVVCRHEAWLSSRGAIGNRGTLLRKVFALSVVPMLALRQVDNSLCSPVW